MLGVTHIQRASERFRSTEKASPIRLERTRGLRIPYCAKRPLLRTAIHGGTAARAMLRPVPCGEFAFSSGRARPLWLPVQVGVKTIPAVERAVQRCSITDTCDSETIALQPVLPLRRTIQPHALHAAAVNSLRIFEVPLTSTIKSRSARDISLVSSCGSCWIDMKRFHPSSRMA